MKRCPVTALIAHLEKIMSKDKMLQQAVLDELAWEPSVDAADIGVTARDGIVTLLGHVTTFAKKFAAEKAARRVNDVKAVAEENGVKMPSFLGYMAWSVGVLVPLFILVGIIFF